jgi:hypothetical protein
MKNIPAFIGRSLEIIRDSISPYKSPNTRLVSAARAVGFRWGTDAPFMDAIEEKTDGTIDRQVTWVMDAGQKVRFRWVEDEDGKPIVREEELNFSEFRSRYLSRDWVQANQDHPIAYLHAVHYHHTGMLKRIKELPQHIVVRHGKRVASIPTDASEEDRKKALKAIGK